MKLNRSNLIVTINASRLLAKTTWLHSVVAQFRSVATRFHSGNRPVCLRSLFIVAANMKK